MGRITLDLNGDVRLGVFYRFHTFSEDGFADLAVQPDWIIARAADPADNRLYKGYVWLEDLLENQRQHRKCPLDASHVTYRYSDEPTADAYSGDILAPFVPTRCESFFGVNRGLAERLRALKSRGARIDPLKINVNQCRISDLKLWALQFTGKVLRRFPKLVGTQNRCPLCGGGQLFCTGCSCPYWRCTVCSREMKVLESLHEGPGDKRIPFEDSHGKLVLEGKSWDGNDLIQASGAPFASKRFIDWLLRIHAAPFYAEPVYFCVDGMSDQQKKWFDELQQPFEV